MKDVQVDLTLECILFGDALHVPFTLGLEYICYLAPASDFVKLVFKVFY